MRLTFMLPVQAAVDSTAPAYMIDQSHNLKGKMEAMVQTVATAQELYAKAPHWSTKLNSLCCRISLPDWSLLKNSTEVRFLDRRSSHVLQRVA